MGTFDGAHGAPASSRGQSEATAAPSGARASRLVAHRLDGRVLKGVSFDFSPQADGFTLRPLGCQEPVRVRMDELKAVFFVKYFDGRPFRREPARPHLRLVDGFAHRLSVEFADGEHLDGFVEADPPPAARGFALVPADADSNNVAVYVVRGPGLRAVRSHQQPVGPPAPPAHALAS